MKNVLSLFMILLLLAAAFILSASAAQAQQIQGMVRYCHREESAKYVSPAQARSRQVGKRAYHFTDHRRRHEREIERDITSGH